MSKQVKQTDIRSLFGRYRAKACVVFMIMVQSGKILKSRTRPTLIAQKACTWEIRILPRAQSLVSWTDSPMLLGLNVNMKRMMVKEPTKFQIWDLKCLPQTNQPSWRGLVSHHLLHHRVCLALVLRLLTSLPWADWEQTSVTANGMPSSNRSLKRLRVFCFQETLKIGGALHHGKRNTHGYGILRQLMLSTAQCVFASPPKYSASVDAVYFSVCICFAPKVFCVSGCSLLLSVCLLRPQRTE